MDQAGDACTILRSYPRGRSANEIPKQSIRNPCIRLVPVLGHSSVAPADQSAIQQKIILLHDQWNRHDMVAYTGNMTEDVQWMNVVGDWWKGKTQVFAALDRHHKTIFKDRQLHPAERLAIRQIAPNVAGSTMINPADAYIGSNGVNQPATRNVLTLVWIKRDGAWLIAQAQNTIEAPAAP